MVVIPGTYVYLIPDIDMDVFFFSGFWYRPSGGHWFRGCSYNGPWAYWPDDRVPRPLLSLPPDYRRVPPGYRRIPRPTSEEIGRDGSVTGTGTGTADWRAGWHGRPEERREEGRPGDHDHGYDHDHAMMVDHDHGR